jgi:hypothetical protein
MEKKRTYSQWDFPKKDVETKTHELKGDEWTDSEGQKWIWNKPEKRYVKDVFVNYN